MQARQQPEEPLKTPGYHTKLLDELYYTASGPSSFSSARRLYNEAKKRDKTIKQKTVNEWLKKQVAYTRHKRVAKNYPRRKVLSTRIDNNWASDVIVMDALSKFNNNFQYIVCTIDLFSRFVWTRAIRQKSKKEMEQALESIIEQNNGKSPYTLWTDRGKVGLAHRIST